MERLGSTSSESVTRRLLRCIGLAGATAVEAEQDPANTHRRRIAATIGWAARIARNYADDRVYNNGRTITYETTWEPVHTTSGSVSRNEVRLSRVDTINRGGWWALRTKLAAVHLYQRPIDATDPALDPADSFRFIPARGDTPATVDHIAAPNSDDELPPETRVFPGMPEWDQLEQSLRAITATGI